MNRTNYDFGYRALYESNPSRAARLRDALASRLNIAKDPELSRKILKDLAYKIGVAIFIGTSEDFRLPAYPAPLVGGDPKMTISEYKTLLDTTPAYESERHLDSLLAYVRSQPDPDKLAKWFIEALATEMMIPFAVGDGDDPVRNLRIMSKALFESFLWAGAVDPAQRSELLRIVLDLVDNLVDEIKEWNAENEGSAAPVLLDGITPPPRTAS